MTENATHPPDVVTYSTIIKGLCDRGEMTSAMQLFNSLPAQGLKPDIVTYNTILEGWAKVGDLEQVETIFKELVATRVKPTCFTLTIMVKFYGRRRLADHVVELVQTLPRVYKFKMDTFAYTATIAACSWNGKLEEAIYYLQEVSSSDRCVPTKRVTMHSDEADIWRGGENVWNNDCWECKAPRLAVSQCCLTIGL